MDGLTTRLADVFRRYQIEFRRMDLLAQDEAEKAAEAFRAEVSALIAEYGRKAVVRAALGLPGELPILN